MKEEVDRSRRSMLWIAPLGGVALRMPAVLLGQKKQGAEEGDEEVTPTEDLMREHGLLKRILLIYDEVDARIAQQKEFPPDAVTNSAKIVSRNEYDALGEDFEKREHQLFGKEGFEGMVPRVEEIEKQLGIYDLSQFTPR